MSATRSVSKFVLRMPKCPCVHIQELTTSNILNRKCWCSQLHARKNNLAASYNKPISDYLMKLIIFFCLAKISTADSNQVIGSYWVAVNRILTSIYEYHLSNWYCNSSWKNQMSTFSLKLFQVKSKM